MAGSQQGLDSELLCALTSGGEACVEELLARQGDGHPRTGSRVAISVLLDAATTGATAAAPLPLRRLGEGPSSLLGLTNTGSTALHLVASRGHAGLARRLCELAPSLVATLDAGLDTPLHRAAKAGHRELAACLPSAMRASGPDADAAVRARNRLGATALYEAVRNGHAETVELLATEAPELASVTTDDGASPLYLAAVTGSTAMVRALLRRSPDGTPSLASVAGPEGRTALHAAAAKSQEIVEEILELSEQGPALLATPDSSGRTALHYALSHSQHGVVSLFLSAEASLARVPDNEGLFPAHVAAMMGSIRNIVELVERCPEYAELVDGQGRNFLHCAIEHDQGNVVGFICRDDGFAALLNAIDYEGNTPLHLAVKYGRPRMVSLLLQNMTVEVGITNRDGLTAADLAYSHLDPGLHYFLNPRAVVKNCLYWTRAPVTLRAGGDHVHLHRRTCNATPATDDDPKKDIDGITATATIASFLIAAVTFAAAFTVPGGYGGAAVLARRLAFRAFVASDTAAFLCSIVATCLLVYGGAGQVPRGQRRLYQRSASGLLPPGAQLMVAAFAFGVHVALGEANRWLVTLVYVLALAAVLLCFPGVWAPLYLGKAIWRRAGWRGLVNVHRRPVSLEEFIWLFTTSFLFKNLARPLFAVLISAAFVVSIALNIAFTNY
ncbi:hypothetical protein BS78_02G299100 [Paspalum vaginatum]|nr:hypothetical protein BS78_02G299100 [Paspalum vaginatum]